MGADVMRWLYAAQKSSPEPALRLRPAEEVKRRLLTLWNTSFFVSYAEIEGFGRRTPTWRPADATSLDRWIVARVNEPPACRAALDGYGRRRTSPVESLIEDLSNWYIRGSRARFCARADDQDAAFARSRAWCR